MEKLKVKFLMGPPECNDPNIPHYSDEFLKELPHTYYEENLIHSYLLTNEKEYQKCLKDVGG